MTEEKNGNPPSARGAMAAGGGKGGSRQVELESILGITVTGNSALTCDPSSGLVAYPAGCVVVLLCPRKNQQSHMFSASSKHLSALSFSPSGTLLVSGESGHNPAVRVWDVARKVQLSEMLSHKYGISCVCFSPNTKYVVSVGYQHDMVVNVWDWKSNLIVAKNKVSSKVSAVSFSEDSSYFVTAGHRHVKFWYLESSKQSQVNGTVPLVGRSGLLGDLHDNVFGGVACGRGKNAASTYCVSYSGLLCQFNEKRVLQKWLKLKVSSSNCLCVTEEFVFCGCEEGVIRMFNAHNLQYVTDLPKPHPLGVDVALSANALLSAGSKGGYPDSCALVYDGGRRWLCSVYNDHSIYVWDVRNAHKVGKVYSALYHSACVWSTEVYPQSGQMPCLPLGSFFTCSSDHTIRLWSSDLGMKRNIYSDDLRKVIYASDQVGGLKDPSGTAEKPESKDSKSGIRVLKVRHDGQQLASGDRAGNIRIYDLKSFEELLTIEAHDGEILSLDYCRPWAGVTLLASASRDRLIHILDVSRDYALLQTLDDHSSCVTAVKFAGAEDQMQIISCGADKSIYFHPAQMLSDGISFVRLHHVVEKTTLYDLDVDVPKKIAAVACQDKTVRLYNISSGKQEKALRGSPCGGALLKVQMDPSGRFFATSCSNKSVSIFDVQTGECVAVMYGHSDIVTDMKFSPDCRRLITVSGDSCVFVWRLDPAMTACMRKQLAESIAEGTANGVVEGRPLVNARDSFMDGPLDESSQDVLFLDGSSDIEETSPHTPINDGSEADPTFLQSNGKLPLWARKLLYQDKSKNDPIHVSSPYQYRPQGRWAESDSAAVCQHLFHGNVISCCSTPNREEDEESFYLDGDSASEQSLESEDGNNYLERIVITEASSASDADVQSQCSEPSSLQEESDFAIEEPTFDSCGLLSGSDPEKFDNTLADLKPDEDVEALNPRLSLSSKFFSGKMERAGCDFVCCRAQVASAFSTEPNGSQGRPPDVRSEQAPDTMKRRKTDRSTANVQKPNEKPPSSRSSSLSSSRSSFPGCWPNKNKSNAGRSYMEATASFQAKIFRSASMGANLNAAEEPWRPPRPSRPPSSTDLCCLEQNKSLPAEDSAAKPLRSSCSPEPISTRQERAKSVGTSKLSDKLLMPPPSTCGIVRPLKKKAKSVNNLSKMSIKEQINFTGRRRASATNRPPDVHDLPRRASIAAFPSHRDLDCHTSSHVVEEPPILSSNSASQASSFSAAGEPRDVTASRCERVLEDLQSAFLKTLQTYQEVESCTASREEKSHLRSLFFDAFDRIQGEMDLVRAGRRVSSAGESPTLRLLERYSDLMLQLLREKLSGP